MIATVRQAESGNKGEVMQQQAMKAVILMIGLVLGATQIAGTPATAAGPKAPPAGSVLMTDEEIEAITLGNSWIYPDGKGGVYFDPDGSALTEWEGKQNPGEWYIENDEVCIDVVDWGGEWCYKFYRVGEDIVFWASTVGEYVGLIVEDGNSF